MAAGRWLQLRRLAFAILVATTGMAWAAPSPLVPATGEDAPAEATPKDIVTVAVPRASLRPGLHDGAVGEAQGAAEPIAPTPDQRRQRARRLSRSPLARERVANADGSLSLVLRNQLHAPVTVEVEAGPASGASVQMLAPARSTIAALGRLEVARVRSTNPMQAGQADFYYTAVVGDPNAVHDDRVTYAWPFPEGAIAHLSQGPGGPTHRSAYSRYAIDLAVPEGTPVLAARAGTVIFLESRYFESGLDPAKFMSRANQVRILHEDGSMASYAHLFPESIEVEPGQHVDVGQRIGLSGNTGYSSGPHLHFVVLVHRDMQMVSVPFRMTGASVQ
jgi:murein DD-endopeptidase MepM/ murein hydrolase activator NlpD